MGLFKRVASSVLALVVLAQAHGGQYINYTTVTGYFLQDDPSTNASTFNYTTTNFGLIDRAYPSDSSCESNNLTQWQRFAHQVSTLNRESPHSITYKVLFMGRHGEGFHNAAESFYGTPAWNCYWAEVDGNGTAVWSDAHLTTSGIAQAQIANNFWRHEIDIQKIPAPQTYYTSPLFRCLQTANITFSGLDLPSSQPFIPTIKHNLRESISIHTCDRRSNKSFIHSSFPSYPFEPNFPEYDDLWNGVTAETSSAQAVRSKSLLDDIFTHDNSTYISFTSHSGEIGSILSVLGHRSFSLSTGAVIPVLVKAETIEESSPTTSSVPWTPSPHCTSPPVTSISGGACICQNSAAPVTTTLPGSGPTYATEL
ncbi:MAG: hypothetical protein M1820_009255 [Bogoriella megaspora]|nr:MAG: hypothetical protein M1820_009255 [Bogoriella megaspora]